jgi:hypothetical protein
MGRVRSGSVCLPARRGHAINRNSGDDPFVGPLDAGHQGGGAADGGLEIGEVVIADAARDAAGVADLDRHAEVDAALPLVRQAGQPTGNSWSRIALRASTEASPSRKMRIWWPAFASAALWPKTIAARVGSSLPQEDFMKIFKTLLFRLPCLPVRAGARLRRDTGVSRSCRAGTCPT